SSPAPPATPSNSAERHARSRDSRTAPRSPAKETPVADHIYRIAEIVGTSPDGVDAAIRNAVTRANQTLRNVDWFEMTEIRGHLADGQVADWQVTVKIGFRLDDGE